MSINNVCISDRSLEVEHDICMRGKYVHSLRYAVSPIPRHFFVGV